MLVQDINSENIIIVVNTKSKYKVNLHQGRNFVSRKDVIKKFTPLLLVYI